MTAPIKDRRLAMRVTGAQEAIIKEAAQSTGQTVTDFSVQAVLSRANELLADQRIFNLDQATWDEFTAILDAPPRVLTKLRDLAAKSSAST